jgi:TPR repeat protein
MKRPIAIAIAAALLTPIATTAPANAEDVGNFTREDLQADIQAFLTSREMARTRTSADNGDPYSIVKIVDALDARYSGNSMVLNEIKVRYLVVAMGQGYGPAFHRMGEMVRLAQLPEGGPMDALGFFEQGAQAGDADSAISYFKMARNLRVCSICEQGERGTETKLIEQVTPEETEALEGVGLSPEYLRIRQGIEDRTISTYTVEKMAMVKKAIGLFEQDSFKDNWEVQSLLANAYIYGVNGAASTDLRNGNFVETGDRKFLAAEPAKAKPILERFAANNEQGALDLLSRLYLTGVIDGFPADRTKFIDYTSRLADLGNINAAYRLGHFMVAGDPFPADFDLGAKYLYMAHEAGSARATFDLARMFYSGRGVPKNEATAFALFEVAGNRGSSEAADIMAQYWRDGVGGTANPMRADMWSKKAEENREKEAQAAALQQQLGLSPI